MLRRLFYLLIFVLLVGSIAYLYAEPAVTRACDGTHYLGGDGDCHYDRTGSDRYLPRDPADSDVDLNGHALTEVGDLSGLFAGPCANATAVAQVTASGTYLCRSIPGAVGDPWVNASGDTLTGPLSLNGHAVQNTSIVGSEQVMTANLSVETGVVASSGMQHIRESATVPALSTAAVNVTWSTSFPDTAYTVTCSVEGSQSEVANIDFKGVTARYQQNVTTVLDNGLDSEKTVSIHCMGMHD